MKSIMYKNYREFIEDKVNILILIIPSLIYIFYSIATKNMDIELVFNKIITLPILYLILFAPKTFAQEKDNRTFETLITTPINFNKVFFGTVIFLLIAVSIPAFVYYIVSLLYTLIFNSGNISSFYSMGITFFMITLVILNGTVGATISSLKSPNLIACSMKLPYLLIIYMIPYTVLQVLLDEGELPHLGIYITFIIINIIIFISLWFSIKKYFYKPLLLEKYGKGVD